MSAVSPEHLNRTVFEFPLNERFRTYLRLESLYARWLFLLAQDSEHAHHSAIMTLFEINELAFRYDLKGDLLMEINRYRQALHHLRHLPSLSEQKLAQTLLRLADAQKQIEMSPKFGSTLADNDWLLNVKTRVLVVSGLCSFDAAFYYQWLQLPAAVRRVDLQSWLMPMMPLFETLQLLLLMVRDACKRKTCVTHNKAYQQSLNGTRFDLMQIEVSKQTPHIPDISANKHVIWVRFTLPAFRCQPKHMYVDANQAEVTFDLQLCGM
ncbi:MAG: cell division protein ZapD [Formosimonas sp.]